MLCLLKKKKTVYWRCIDTVADLNKLHVHNLGGGGGGGGDFFL